MRRLVLDDLRLWHLGESERLAHLGDGLGALAREDEHVAGERAEPKRLGALS